MKCCICGTIKNCEKYINDVLKNMKLIGLLFEDFDIILFYDNSEDKTLNILKDFQKENNNLYISDFDIIALKSILASIDDYMNSNNNIMEPTEG